MPSSLRVEAYNPSTLTFDWHLEISKEVIPQNSSILDVACGAAEFSISLAKSKDVSFLAIDSSPEAIEIAKRNADGLIGFKSQVMDAEDLSVLDSSYDIVLMRYAIHHFHNLEKALNEAYRVLNEGGQLHILDVFSYEDPEVDAFFNKITTLLQPENYRFYPKSTLEKMCYAAGFNTVSLSEKSISMEIKRWARASDNYRQIIDLFDSANEKIRGALNLRENPLGDDNLADFVTFYLVAHK